MDKQIRIALIGFGSMGRNYTAMLAGNLAQLLQNVAGISRELVCDGAAVLPWVAFRGVTVSGG